MSKTNLITKQIDRLKKSPCARTFKGASDSEIRSLASALNVRLPSSYTMFLRECGWAELNGEVVFGWGADIEPDCSVLEIADFESVMASPQMPHRLIPLMNDGSGNHECLDTSKIKDGDCPVVFWDHEHPRGILQSPKRISVSFTAWLKRKIDELPAIDA